MRQRRPRGRAETGAGAEPRHKATTVNQGTFMQNALRERRRRSQTEKERGGGTKPQSELQIHKLIVGPLRFNDAGVMQACRTSMRRGKMLFACVVS